MIFQRFKIIFKFISLKIHMNKDGELLTGHNFSEEVYIDEL